MARRNWDKNPVGIWLQTEGSKMIHRNDVNGLYIRDGIIKVYHKNFEGNPVADDIDITEHVIINIGILQIQREGDR